jgi:signal transduction histidine kinase
MMPEMDGNEVLAAIRSNAATQLIPFIFITAMTERKNVRNGMEDGADDYITKPFTREELLKTVNARLQKSEKINSRSELALDELRNNLILNLPHELRTPLNGILGFGQILKDNPESFNTSEVSEIGNHIYKSANRLFHLIRNYLLYAQLELQKIPFPDSPELNNPDLICIEVGNRIASRYERTSDLKIDSHPGVALVNEPEYIKILEELIDNAFKFSKQGQLVELKCAPKNGKYIVTVVDNGRGINAADLKTIGPLMQFDRRTYEQQGSGLGLIIAKKLTELFHGTLEVQSNPDQGTTVTIELPGGKSVS